MVFSIYLPDSKNAVPYLIWLSGLTCSDQNFITKAGAFGIASKLGVAIICPDTSPRISLFNKKNSPQKQKI